MPVLSPSTLAVPSGTMSGPTDISRHLKKWCFKNIPLWERYLRLRLFLASDSLVATYMPGSAAAKLRNTVEEHARQYICGQAPRRYHKALVPDFPLGELFYPAS